MEEWQKILKGSINNFDQLKIEISEKGLSTDSIKTLPPTSFPLKINRYYFDLIQKENDPIWKQCIPSANEQYDNVCMSDPLGEDKHSPVPGLVHKYPDRALLLVTHKCSVYCRFCTRNRVVGQPQMSLSKSELSECYKHLRETPSIREVLISGGDPLLLADNQIEEILTELRSIKSIEVIRIGTRVPCTLPHRITDNLVNILKKFHPLYINTHFNHPVELTKEANIACCKLADTGIPLGCQTVLLKDINDDAETLKELFLGLLKIRVKPYYLFQADLTKGTNHFRTPTSTGIRILKELYGHISGMAVPRLALDGPDGKGKIMLSPEYIIEKGDSLIFENYLGQRGEYPEIIHYL